MRKQWKRWQTLFSWALKITADGDWSHEIKRHLLLGWKAMTNLDSVLKSRDITLLTNVCRVKAIYDFSSSYVWIWELDHKEGGVLKNLSFQSGVLEKTPESPLDLKGSNQSNFFFFLLYNIVLVLPYINMNPPRVYICFSSWTTSHLPPHTIPLGHPSAPAPSILYHALNLDWRFISHTIIYMFQCHSPKSSHQTVENS